MVTKNQVKYIQSLSHKKFRDEEDVFVAEGPKIVGELIGMSHIRVKQVYGTSEWWAFAEKWKDEPWAVPIDDADLERLSFQKTPNQVLGIFYKPHLVTAAGGWQLLLDGIQDPGNLGTIIRIADWYGITQVVCSEDCADAFNPKVIQSTMASIGRVEVTYANLLQYVKQHAHRTFYAATLNGVPMQDVKPHGQSALVIGNESKGIRPELMTALRNFVTIPRNGEAESLNAAVATGILLSHLINR